MSLYVLITLLLIANVITEAMSAPPAVLRNVLNSEFSREKKKSRNNQSIMTIVLTFEKFNKFCEVCQKKTKDQELSFLFCQPAGQPGAFVPFCCLNFVEFCESLPQ